MKDGLRYTIILKVKDHLNFKVRKGCQKLCFNHIQIQLLCDPAENIHGVIINKYQIDLVL